METRIFENTKDDIKKAAQLIKNGETVVFPTETVYGLGANALDSDAVKKIFAAKGRPSDNPLIVHIADFEKAKEFAQEIPEKAKLIAEKFCPGPITMIFKKKPCIPNEVSAGLDTVGIRIPEDEIAREFLKECNLPVAAPSANVSGRPSPTSYGHVLEDMYGKVSGIIHGADSFVGVESTVIDMTSKIPTVLRPGGVSVEELREVLGEVLVSAELKDDGIPKAPGMKYKHYSPKGKTFILKGTPREWSKFLEKRGKVTKTSVLAFDEDKEYIPDNVEFLSLGSKEDPHDAAKRLFDCLRRCDQLGAKEIYAPEIPEDGLWRAVKNRLYKAAAGRLIDLKTAKTVLFVCTGNTCRSPIAEGLFNISGKNGIAASAGLLADKSEVSLNSVKAAAELGADIKSHISSQLTEEMLKNYDIILTMTAAHKDLLPGRENIWTLSEFVGEEDDINDPYGLDIESYRAAAKTIKRLVEKIKL